MKKTNNCGELNAKDENKEAILMGWVDTRRDHGGVIFVDLRDREGITQIVFNPEFNAKTHKKADGLRREFVIAVKGIVKKRKEGMANPNLKTGEIEVFANELEIITKAETPPIEIDDKKVANEDMRLKFRYLDLRRPQMIGNLKFRHKVVTAAREYFNANGFIEIETPILVRPTPEGARDYLVPSRVSPGNFYALPQSPQLYKQILMIAGIERYYQIARCLRDEDLRADRQPEHTQFDLEMSFVDEEDIREAVEGLYKYIFKKALNIEFKEKFPVLTYDEAMDKYGIDKPDIRFELFLKDVTSIVVKSDFGVFKDVVKNGGIIKCVVAPKDLPRKEIDDLIKFSQENGAKGMAWMRVSDKGLESNIAKYFSEPVQKELIKAIGAKPNSIIMFIAEKKKKCNEVLAKLRLEIARRLDLIPKNKFAFCWVVDFPLFEFDEDTQAWVPAHHMFSMPKKEHWKYLETEPGKVYANLYDIILNGVELGSGSMRIHDPELQEKVMKVIGLSKEDAYRKFGFLLEAYKYGAPMHGGMGLGVDRLVAMMLGTNDIREVIAFPKNKAAQCPMDDSPNVIDEAQLKELHIKVDVIKVDKEEVFRRITESMKKEGIKYDVIEHEATFTSEESAKARGTELKQGVKALVCRAGKKFVQICVPGNKEIDLGKASLAIGAKIETANANEVREAIQCPIGAVPPFGNIFGIDVFIDEDVLKNEHVAFNAGLHTRSIKMKAKDLAKVTKAKIGKFSK
jgi:aspartyl-tRNA synthetase